MGHLYVRSDTYQIYLYYVGHILHRIYLCYMGHTLYRIFVISGTQIWHIFVLNTCIGCIYTTPDTLYQIYLCYIGHIHVTSDIFVYRTRIGHIYVLSNTYLKYLLYGTYLYYDGPIFSIGLFMLYPKPLSDIFMCRKDLNIMLY